MPEPDVVAAGAVVFRPGHEVLLVHRARHGDWSLPKGKLDPGEHPTSAAVREVGEETGLRVRLGPPLADQHYPVGPLSKTVHWWVARPVGDSDVSSYAANDEIDDVDWVSRDEAMTRLTYDRDRTTLVEATRHRKRTRALVVLRHAKAESRESWTDRPDPERPLTATGHAQALRLVPVLEAYGLTRVISSSSVRCLQTVSPYADATGVKVEETSGLTEEHATRDSVVEILSDLMHGSDPAVLCTHRPVLPDVLHTLRIAPETLRPAGLVVAHHRRGHVAAAELHQRV